MLVPYRADVPMRRWPIANFVILGLMVVAFIAQQQASGTALIRHVLYGWDLSGLFGHMWLHGGPIHLFGNMIFLWVFGNAVCAKVGNAGYAPLYLGCGLVAAVAHNLMDGAPALGASGAINGIVGAFAVLYPLNNISCFLWLFIFIRWFSVSSIWMILLWLVFDIWGAVSGGGQIAYFAHLGGFAAGFGAMFLALRLRWITMEPDERSLLQVFGRPAPVARRRRTPPPVTTPEPTESPGTMREYFEREQQRARGGAAAPVGGRLRSSAPGRPPGSAPSAQKPKSDSVRMKCVCGKALRVPRALSGKTAQCPACKQTIRIPDI